MKSYPDSINSITFDEPPISHQLLAQLWLLRGEFEQVCLFVQIIDVAALTKGNYKITNHGSDVRVRKTTLGCHVDRWLAAWVVSRQAEDEHTRTLPSLPFLPL